MSATVISVTFLTQTQPSSNGRFSVPTKVCDLLDLDSSTPIGLVIESSKGTLVITKTLMSGTEIYGPEIAQHVTNDPTIRVTVYRPVK